MSFFSKLLGQTFLLHEGREESSNSSSESERRRKRKFRFKESMNKEQMTNHGNQSDLVAPDFPSNPGKNDEDEHNSQNTIEFCNLYGMNKTSEDKNIDWTGGESKTLGKDIKLSSGLDSPILQENLFMTNQPFQNQSKKKNAVKIYKGAAFQLPVFDQLEVYSDQKILSSSPSGLGSFLLQSKSKGHLTLSTEVYTDINTSSLEFTKKLKMKPSLPSQENTPKPPRQISDERNSINQSNTIRVNSNCLSEAMRPIFQKIGSVNDKNIDDVTGRPMKHRNHSNLDLDDSNEELSLRYEKIMNILRSPHANIADLRRLAWNGLPSKARADAWKLIVGYLPSSKNRREEFLQTKRREYQDMVDKYYYDRIMQKTEEESNILHQIHIDVPRTNPEVPIFQLQSVQNALERILYVWSIRHASGYVQGLNDIVTPFLVVYLYDKVQIPNLLESNIDTLISAEDFQGVEADTFFSFSLFLDMIQDHYSFGQPGIHRMIKKLEDIIQKIDKALFNHFQELNLHFLQFAFRWMNCVLMRELSLKQVLRLFDTFLSEANEKDSFEKIHVYVCAAFLKNWSEDLKLLDFTDLVIFLQHLPTQNWTEDDIGMLLSQAYMLMSWFEY